MVTASLLSTTKQRQSLGRHTHSKDLAFFQCANALRLSYTVARDGLVTDLEVLKGMITILLFQFILQEYPVQRPPIISLSSKKIVMWSLAAIGFGNTHRCLNWHQQGRHAFLFEKWETHRILLFNKTSGLRPQDGHVECCGSVFWILTVWGWLIWNGSTPAYIGLQITSSCPTRHCNWLILVPYRFEFPRLKNSQWKQFIIQGFRKFLPGVRFRCFKIKQINLIQKFNNRSIGWLYSVKANYIHSLLC